MGNNAVGYYGDKYGEPFLSYRGNGRYMMRMNSDYSIDIVLEDGSVKLWHSGRDKEKSLRAVSFWKPIQPWKPIKKVIG